MSGEPLPAADLAAFRSDLEASLGGRASFDTGTRALYTTDASNYRSAPLGVLLPRDGDDVEAALAVCRAYGVPLVPRGGGTSVAGNALGAGGLLVDTSRHMTGITPVDPVARTVRVEPGAVLDDVRAAAAPHGLTFGPDPSTHSRCTVGGMIGNNACGSHSVAWGTTADNVESLDVVLADGTRMTVGATSTEDMARRAARPDREGRLYAGLRDLAERYLADLRTGMPALSRRVSGYPLDRLLPENGRHVARALTGTEGTCAVVLGATLRLVEAPAARALAVLGYPDAPTAGDAVPGLLAGRPLTVEGVDSALVTAWHGRQPRGAPDPRHLLPDGGAWLLVEVGGDDAAEAAERARVLLAAADRASAGPRPVGTRLVAEAGRQRLLWRIREEGAGIATRLPDGAEAWPGIEDAAVPPEHLGAYLRDFDRLLGGHDLRGLVYGHFGEGCLHVRVNFDLLTPGGVRRFSDFMTEAADLVAGHGGSLSGEHGDGRARSALLPRLFPPRVIDAFAEFKDLWDPENLLNPGVVVRPAALDAQLRPARVTATPGGVLPLFAYADDHGSLPRAVRRCVGVGKCRQTAGSGVMCPSYRVTREERHSTRGRAHLLSEMVTGELVTDGWRSAEVRDALDLCLSCKGCASDCPVGVDVATYKSEFLHHHYRHRPRPAAHYSMGWLPLWSALATTPPGVARALNLATRRSGVARLLKRAGGIAPERSLPEFAPEPFTRWFRRRAAATRGGATDRPPVLLWPDTFGNHLAPEVPRAAVEVLEDAGFRVVLPRGPVCCGLTWVSTGQLGTARRVMSRTLAALAPHVAAGTPVVGLEPSCTAALRSDLPELLPADARSTPTARAVHTLAEFLTDRAPDWRPPHVGRPAVTQVHCHQHAVLGFDSDARLLERAGIAQDRLVPGCCGLAGNFGFERGHHEVSQAIGEQALLPAVREADEDTLVLADGFSCRTQIAQGTGRRGLHLAEVLAAALRAERGRASGGDAGHGRGVGRAGGLVDGRPGTTGGTCC